MQFVQVNYENSIDSNNCASSLSCVDVFSYKNWKLLLNDYKNAIKCQTELPATNRKLIVSGHAKRLIIFIGFCYYWKRLVIFIFRRTFFFSRRKL